MENTKKQETCTKSNHRKNKETLDKPLKNDRTIQV